MELGSMNGGTCPKCRVPFEQDAHGDWYCAECGFVPDPDEWFTIEVRTAREITALPDPDESDLLVGPLVRIGARTIVVAAPGHGKTTLAGQFVSAALSGWEALGYFGAKVGPALIIDLEQGIRSIKRALRDVGLENREDVLYVQVPDGLALDSDEEHRAEVERVLEEHRPVLVVLDPYYKAHRGESNEERGVVDLMRYLDGLRARYGFALIMPAHPRQDQTGRNGARKLTLDESPGRGQLRAEPRLWLGSSGFRMGSRGCAS
jgi:RecA-family ATPase